MSAGFIWRTLDPGSVSSAGEAAGQEPGNKPVRFLKATSKARPSGVGPNDMSAIHGRSIAKAGIGARVWTSFDESSNGITSHHA